MYMYITRQEAAARSNVRNVLTFLLILALSASETAFCLRSSVCLACSSQKASAFTTEESYFSSLVQTQTTELVKSLLNSSVPVKRP